MAKTIPGPVAVAGAEGVGKCNHIGYLLRQGQTTIIAAGLVGLEAQIRVMGEEAETTKMETMAAMVTIHPLQQPAQLSLQAEDMAVGKGVTIPTTALGGRLDLLGILVVRPVELVGKDTGRQRTPPMGRTDHMAANHHAQAGQLQESMARGALGV